MRDGTVLRADVYRPETRTDLPVLLIRSIYDKRSGIPTFGSAHPAWFAAQGYVVVVQDCRGRYASEGDFYPYLHEMEDGYDSVEWAARLPGSDGRVGMMGFSYVGATQLLAAVTAPPSLASITPAFTASQYYDGWTYNGGAFSLAFIGYWATLLGLETAQRAGDLEGHIGLAAAEWIIQRQVTMIGSDSWGSEVIPSPDERLVFPVHQELLTKHGLFNLENRQLDELVTDVVYEFLFIVTPIRFRGATGSPARPIAIR